MLLLPGKISPEKRRAILNKLKSSLHPLLGKAQEAFFAEFGLFTREYILHS